MGSEYFRKIPYKQDMPPPGGYPKLAFAQSLPNRIRFNGVAIMASGVAVMAVGWVFLARGNKALNKLSKERTVAKLSLIPLLTAEADRDLLRQVKKSWEEEKLLMQDDVGWEAGASCYNTERWVNPMFVKLSDCPKL